MSGRPFGVLLVDKPAGPTSHEVVQWVRWALGERSVGHCGTLDPAATGLLVLLVGAATRLAPLYTAQDKRYWASFALGVATDTADAQGQEIARAPVPPAVWARAETTLRDMVGDLELAPPAHAAVKIDGVRAYELARKGQAPELPARAMGLLAVQDLSVRPEDGAVEASVDVTKGTYVRSLAVELGRRLGVPAHLRALRRTRVGALDLEETSAVVGPLTVQAMPPARDGSPRHRIRPAPGLCGPSRQDQRELLRQRLGSPLDPPLAPLPVTVQPEPVVRRLAHGQPTDLVGLDEPVGISAPGASGPGEGSERMPRTLVTDPGRHVVIVAARQGQDPWGYRPERVVRGPDPARKAP